MFNPGNPIPNDRSGSLDASSAPTIDSAQGHPTEPAMAAVERAACDQLGRFPVQREIGRGGMGIVYLGHDPTLDRPVALKVLPGAFLRDAERRTRFEREARVLAALNHPNVAVIHSLETAEDGARFLVLEFVEGQGLGERLHQGPVPLQEAARLCVQIARGLEAAHGRGVVHRDLKPDNVRITPDGLVKVLDFGLAVREERDGAGSGGAPTGVSADPAGSGGSGQISGTAGYMSPEQAQGLAQDRRTDIFSFGCVLFECLAGRAAFPGRTVFDRIVAVQANQPDYAALPPGIPTTLRDLLTRCLEKEPTRRLAEIRDARRVLEELLGERPSASLRPGAVTAVPNNLPRLLTSFIGREQELAAIKERLPSTSVLTLTGAGGCGKTRLALRLAGDLLEEHADGVWLVDLGPLSDPAQVPAAALAALGARDTAGLMPVQSLAGHLEGKHVLVLLDNCEHLLEACRGLVHTLLSACPGLKFLVTSQEALGVAGETAWPVPSLLLPPGEFDPGEAVDAARRFEAVELLLERARAVQPGFQLTPQNAPVVARICRRLDGIPLAIELAAARLRFLSIEQIEIKLDDRFRLLTGGSRTALKRHQTLQEAIAWSYGLLTEQERRDLRALSVFPGGCDLAAAAAAWGTADDFDAIEQLSHLVDKSLVVIEDGDPYPRYRLLESVRLFARAEAERAGEIEVLRDRHAEFFHALSAEANAMVLGPQQAMWLNRLEADHENLVAAGRWLGQRPATAERGLDLCANLWFFWHQRGHFSIGRSLLAEALAWEGARTICLPRARGLHGAGSLAWLQGDAASARESHGEALRIARELDDRQWIAHSLLGLGHAHTYMGDLAAARVSIEEALDILRERGDRQGMLNCINALGNLAWREGDIPTARKHYTECLPLARERSNRSAEATILGNLGAIGLEQEDLVSARELFQQALAIHRAQGNRHGIAQTLCNLGTAARLQDDFGPARSYFEESLILFRDLGSRDGAAQVLYCLGKVAWTERDRDAARRFYEESASIFRQLNIIDLEADVLLDLALIALELLELDVARTHLCAAVTRYREVTGRLDIAPVLDGVAAFAGAAGEPRLAVCLRAAAGRVREEGEERLSAADEAPISLALESARTLLSETEFNQAWARGRELDGRAALGEAFSYLAHRDGSGRAGIVL